MKEGNYIPKIIHYCWFGKVEKPDNVKKNIKQWKEILPNFVFIEWNEDNFPIDFNSYTKEAYSRKKFAFVSDLARLYALEKYGGFYFDTDVELLKNIETYCHENRVILAFESSKEIMTAFIGAPAHNVFISECIKLYDNLFFVNKDGSLNLLPNTSRITELLVLYGLKLNGTEQILDKDIHVYPISRFGAYDVDNSCYIDSDNTVLIHHCASSWQTSTYQNIDKFKRKIAKIIGRENVIKIRKLKYYFKRDC